MGPLLIRMHFSNRCRASGVRLLRPTFWPPQRHTAENPRLRGRPLIRLCRKNRHPFPVPLLTAPPALATMLARLSRTETWALKFTLHNLTTLLSCTGFANILKMIRCPHVQRIIVSVVGLGTMMARDLAARQIEWFPDHVRPCPTNTCHSTVRLTRASHSRVDWLFESNL